MKLKIFKEFSVFLLKYLMFNPEHTGSIDPMLSTLKVQDQAAYFAWIDASPVTSRCVVRISLCLYCRMCPTGGTIYFWPACQMMM